MRHLLILKGADVNARAADGSTPLTVALRGGNATVVETLLRCGASLRPENVPDAEQPFTVATTTGNPKMTDLLRRREMLQQARVLHAVPRQPGDDRPDALHDAIMRDDPDGIERLLDAGADIERPDAVNQETPLTRALGYGKVESVFTLLQRGANPNHARPSDGNTPLMNTLGWSGLSLDGMRLYLHLLGADVRATRPDGHTEMTHACLAGNTHAVRWLVWSGVSPTEAGKLGTPMEVASRAGYQNVINLLKDFGVPVVIFKSDDPVWNLHNAAKRGDRAEIDRLLAAGAPVDAADEGGDSPLMQAIGHADMTTARHLIARGAGINYQNPKGGWTPLIVTTVWEFPAITTFRAELLQAGADPNLTARNGMTAAMRAACSEDPGTGLRQIVEAGADLNLRDDQGKTVLGQAVANNRKGTAEYLRKHGAQE